MGVKFSGTMAHGTDVAPDFIYGTTRPTPGNTYFWEFGGPTMHLTSVPGTSGLLTISAPGIYTDNDYQCYVTIDGTSATAANPIILRDSLLRGPAAGLGTTVERNLLTITNVTEVGAVIVERNRFNPDFHFDQLRCVRMQGNAVVQRNHFSSSVDYVCMVGDNNLLQGCYGRDSTLLPTTHQSNGYTHDDGDQISGGGNNTIFGCDFEGCQNTAIFAKAENPSLYGAITGLLVDHNWLDDGAACISAFKKAADAAMSVTITNNILGPRACTGATYQIYIANTVVATVSGNTKASDGSPVVVTYYNAG